MPTIALVLIVAVIAAAAGIGGGYFIGYNNRKKTAEAQIGSAEAYLEAEYGLTPARLMRLRRMYLE